MDVFISWSKERSRLVAEALHDWLPDVIQGIRPWTSSVDIQSGARWPLALADALEQCRVGILCVTSDNYDEPWLVFEAGALSKLRNTIVCPYLVDMGLNDLPTGPLSQFQARLADEDGTRALVRSINSARGEDGIAPTRIERAFGAFWPRLRDSLAKLPEGKPVPQPSEKEMLAELLAITRQSRQGEFLPPQTVDSREWWNKGQHGLFLGDPQFQRETTYDVTFSGDSTCRAAMERCLLENLPARANARETQRDSTAMRLIVSDEMPNEVVRQTIGACSIKAGVRSVDVKRRN